MRDQPLAGFADRLKTAAAARQALLDKLKPRPTVTDPDHDTRAERQAAQMKALRIARVEARNDRRQRAEDADAAARAVQLAADEAALADKRGERKARKALTAAESKAKRDAKYAARQARR